MSNFNHGLKVLNVQRNTASFGQDTRCLESALDVSPVERHLGQGCDVFIPQGAGSVAPVEEVTPDSGPRSLIELLEGKGEVDARLERIVNVDVAVGRENYGSAVVLQTSEED